MASMSRSNLFFCGITAAFFVWVPVRLTMTHGRQWELGPSGLPRSLIAADGLHYADGMPINPLTFHLVRFGYEDEFYLAFLVLFGVMAVLLIRQLRIRGRLLQQLKLPSDAPKEESPGIQTTEVSEKVRTLNRNRFIVLILFGHLPLWMLLAWLAFGYGCLVPGQFLIFKASVLSDGHTLANGREVPTWLLWMVQDDMQDHVVLLLAALSFAGQVGYRARTKQIRELQDNPEPTLWDLSTPLIALSPDDNWTIGDSCMGTFITGATGAGKTTGPGAAIAKVFMDSGYGGLVICVKKDERRNWERYARECRREQDLMILDSSCQQRYSFLDEELQRKGEGAGLTQNIVNLFTTILEVAERSGGGKDSEPYWKRALQQLARNLVDLLVLAQGRATVPDLYRLAVSAPTSLEQLHSEVWRKQSFCYQCLRQADQNPKTPRGARDFSLVADYFTAEFPGLSDRTRSVILSSFTSLTDVLNRGLLREIFSQDTTLRPEEAFQGKIIIVDLPVKEFLEVGQFASVLMKFCFQRAVERRTVTKNARPVFLWVDECQEVMTSSDMPFQATARSSKVATVYLTQNISTMHAAFGGDQPEALTNSLTGNLQTKVLCASGDPVTNEWAASIIGKSRQFFINSSQSTSVNEHSWLPSDSGQSQVTSGVTEQMDFEVTPQRFTTLKTGGPKNGWRVETIVFQGGRKFVATDATWLPVQFRQHH